MARQVTFVFVSLVLLVSCKDKDAIATRACSEIMLGNGGVSEWNAAVDELGQSNYYNDRAGYLLRTIERNEMFGDANPDNLVVECKEALLRSENILREDR